MGLRRVAELGQHDRGADDGMGGDVQGVAAAVIKPGQDLHVSAVIRTTVLRLLIVELSLVLDRPHPSEVRD